MTRDRIFALCMVALALATGLVLIAGDHTAQRIGWGLWPLLVVLPVVFGRLRMRHR